MLLQNKFGNIRNLEYPIYASLDHPLFAFGGKRVEKKEMKTPSMREAERGVTSAAMSG